MFSCFTLWRLPLTSCNLLSVQTTLLFFCISEFLSSFKEFCATSGKQLLEKVIWLPDSEIRSEVRLSDNASVTEISGACRPIIFSKMFLAELSVDTCFRKDPERFAIGSATESSSPECLVWTILLSDVRPQ